MVDLDEFAKSRRYFKNKTWRGTQGSINYTAIVRAIQALGGTLNIEWIDE